MEKWKPYPKHPLYEFSSEGRARKWMPPVCRTYGQGGQGSVYRREGRYRYLKCSPNPVTGYPAVSMTTDGVKDQMFVHRVVCELFVGACPGDIYTVDHLNGIRHDNRADNLRWATHSEQRDTARILGTLNAGDRHYKSVIPDEDIKMIREEYVPKCKQHGAAAIAARYGVTRQCVGRIVRGESRV